jgi:hypothetical protein
MVEAITDGRQWTVESETALRLASSHQIYGLHSIKYFGFVVRNMDNTGAKRVAPDWIYPYLAGQLDTGGVLQIVVGLNKTATINYSITPTIEITGKHPSTAGMLDEIIEMHGWSASLERRSVGRRYRITTREDVAEFCELVEPFVIGHLPALQIMKDVILPEVRKGTAGNKTGFMSVMMAVEAFRGQLPQASKSKYTIEYFADEWEIDPDEVDPPKGLSTIINDDLNRKS